jgi:signal peptidase I
MSRQEDYAYEDEQGEHTGARLLREVLEVAILTLLFFSVVRLLVQNYRVDGPSMQRTLYTNEYILVDKAAYYLHPPQRGDVVVFQYPLDTSVNFVKRVIGVPGDEVQIDVNGTVTVNGKVLNEPYVYQQLCPCDPKSIVLQPNQYYVMGDHRGDSDDSRDWGPVPRSDIIGKASLVYWPLPDVHMIPSWSGVFTNIPPSP